MFEKIFSNTNKDNKSLAQIRKDSYNEGYNQALKDMERTMKNGININVPDTPDVWGSKFGND